jgi:hypothetical protein
MDVLRQHERKTPAGKNQLAGAILPDNEGRKLPVERAARERVGH